MKILMVMISSALVCFAQAGRSELFGLVQDPMGLPVSAAKIQAEEQSTHARFTGISDMRGEYHLIGLPPGQYVLTVEQPGFHTYRHSGITLRLEDRTALNVKLEIGQPAESVEVTGEAPLLETATGQVGFHVDEKKV